MQANKYSVVSLFSGCGGMDLGFLGGFDFLDRHYEKTNFEIIWANDINETACNTYRSNIGSHVITGDVFSVMDTLPKYADVVIGGFPCQDISINGDLEQHDRDEHFSHIWSLAGKSRASCYELKKKAAEKIEHEHERERNDATCKQGNQGSGGLIRCFRGVGCLQTRPRGGRTALCRADEFRL